MSSRDFTIRRDSRAASGTPRPAFRSAGALGGRRIFRAIGLLVLGWWIGPTGCGATAGDSGSAPFLAVGRTASPPAIDGELDDACWRRAVRILVLQDWRNGGVVQPETQVLVCWDSTGLYAAWDCREPQMKAILARRDGDVWRDDDVEVFLQAPGRLDYMHYMVNPLGRLASESSTGKAVRSRARAAARRGRDRWSVELFIPWRELGGPPRTGVPWRGNFHRVRKPKPEAFGCWAVTGGPFHNPKRFGQIRFADSAPVRLARLAPGALTVVYNRAEFAGRGQPPQGAGMAVIRLGGAVLARKRFEAGRPWTLEAGYSLDFQASAPLIFEVRSGHGDLWYRRAFPVNVPGRELLAALRRAGSIPRPAGLSQALQRGLDREFGRARGILEQAAVAVHEAVAVRKNVAPEVWHRIVRSAARAMQSRSRPVLWTETPYQTVRPGSFPETLPAPPVLRVQAFGNEYETASLLVSNLRGGRPLALRVRLTALVSQPGAASGAAAAPRLDRSRIRLAEAVPVRTAQHGRIMDAIVGLDRVGRLFVPFGETRELWITVNTFGARPGLYRGLLRIQSMDPKIDPWILSVPVAVRIWPVELAPTERIRVFNFDYYRGGASDAFLRDLLQHRVNVFALQAPVPDPKTGIADFSKLDAPVARVKGHGMIFFESWFFRAKGWKPQYARWVRDLVAYMKSKGLGYDDWVLHIFDETLSDRFLNTARAIKKIDPHLRLFSDRMGPPARIAEFAPVVDFWCPHFRDLTKPGLEAMRRSGHPVWTYDCGSGKAIPPAHNRALPWCAWHYHLDGVCYWTYFANYGDPWNDFDQGHPDWSKVYTDAAGNPVPSKRWEAWREGLEDWALFDLYARFRKQNGGAGQQAKDRRLEADIAAVGAAADAPAAALADIVDRVRRRVLAFRGIREPAFPAYCEVAWTVRRAGDGRGRVEPLPAEGGKPERQVGAYILSPTTRSWTFLIQSIQAQPGDRIVLLFRARGRGKLKAGICQGFPWGGNGAGHRTAIRFTELAEHRWQSLRIPFTAGRERPLEALIGFDYGNPEAHAELRDYRIQVLPGP